MLYQYALTLLTTHSTGRDAAFTDTDATTHNAAMIRLIMLYDISHSNLTF